MFGVVNMKNRTDLPISIFRLCLVLICAALLPTTAAAAASWENITQNWEAAAVFYDSPCTDTETFHMTEDEFYSAKVELESQVVLAYGRLYGQLSGETRSALKLAQKDWVACYYAYLDSLAQRWTEPVKIYFADPEEERRTVLYRDFALVMLCQRLDDLDSWAKGRLAYVESAAIADKQDELIEAKKQLQIDMGLCLYVIDEPYREKITAAHRSFYRFLDSNDQFVELLSNGNEAQIVAENLLQVQRMSSLTSDYYYGCRFFRREREE